MKAAWPRLACPLWPTSSMRPMPQIAQMSTFVASPVRKSPRRKGAATATISRSAYQKPWAGCLKSRISAS
jgi:hypothetical protein